MNKEEKKIKEEIASTIKADNKREVEFVNKRNGGWRGLVLGEGFIEVWTCKMDSMANAGDQRFLMTKQPVKLYNKESRMAALEKVLIYARARHELGKSENSYTVRWVNVGPDRKENESNECISYFWANSYGHVEEKFHAGGEKRVILSIEINPVS